MIPTTQKYCIIFGAATQAKNRWLLFLYNFLVTVQIPSLLRTKIHAKSPLAMDFCLQPPRCFTVFAAKCKYLSELLHFLGGLIQWQSTKNEKTDATQPQ